jgi:hypothetical protein
MHKSATKCNETIGKWCKNKHGASKIIDTLEMYHLLLPCLLYPNLHNGFDVLSVAPAVNQSGVDPLDRRHGLVSGNESWGLRWNLFHQPIRLPGS